jgi:hypothetical protein
VACLGVLVAQNTCEEAGAPWFAKDAL